MPKIGAEVIRLQGPVIWARDNTLVVGIRATILVVAGYPEHSRCYHPDHGHDHGRHHHCGHHRHLCRLNLRLPCDLLHLAVVARGLDELRAGTRPTQLQAVSFAGPPGSSVRLVMRGRREPKAVEMHLARPRPEGRR